jgi:hypothetical protein
MIIFMIFLVAALIVFGIAAFAPPTLPVNLIALGLALWVLAELAGHVAL